jgi:hypothetical protein
MAGITPKVAAFYLVLAIIFVVLLTLKEQDAAIYFGIVAVAIFATHMLVLFITKDSATIAASN